MSEHLPMADDLRDHLQNPHEFMRRRYGEQITRYQQAGRIGRWLIARKHPEVANWVEFLKAQQSIEDAKRSAYANEGREIIF